MECTHTYFAGGSSGIRRVARNLANAHHQVSDERGQLLPLVWAGQMFLRPRRPLTEAPHPLVRLRAVLLAFRTRSEQLCHHCLSFIARVFGRVGQPLPLAMPARLILWLLQAARRGLRTLLCPVICLGRALRDWLRRGRGNHETLYRLFGLLAWPGGLFFAEPVRFHRGDIVVLVDSTWDSPAMLEALFTARDRDGIRVGAMLHDLFPLTIPQMCQTRTVENYVDWFQRVAAEVDFFIANSAATNRALENYLGEHPDLRGRPLVTGHFRLGAELTSPVPITPDPLLALSGFVVLAVGTLEPRKNYTVILDALDSLWEQPDVILVIVGRPGWAHDEILQRIRGHRLLGSRLLHLDDADDATLAAAYRRADILVCASWAEGFGLPIVEGIRHGLPVLASDIDVFREVGGAACRYFAPGCPAELATELQQHLELWQAGAPVRLEQRELAISWAESAVQFRDEVLRIAAAEAASRSTDSVSAAASSQL